MIYDRSKKRARVAITECYSLQFSNNYEIPRNVTDKNMKFTAKSKHIVTCGSFEIFKYI